MIKCKLNMGVNMQNSTDHEKILHIISFFEGEALAWMEPILELHYSGVPQPRMDNLAIFNRDFMAAFGEVDREESYRQKYCACPQTKLVTEYISDFRLFSSVLGYNDTTLKDGFYRGLKDSVKDVMMNQNYDKNMVTIQ